MSIRSKHVEASVALRQALELAIVSKLIDVLLAEGCQLAVDNGSDDVSSPSIVKDDILAVMGETDADRLLVYRDDNCIGLVFLVYGNDGFDVISDYLFGKQYYSTFQTLISGIDTESFTVTLV
jgi:hypothetical protein